MTLPSLRSLNFSGGAQATVSGFSSDGDLDVTLSGAGTLNMDNMKCGSTSFDVSGGGTVSGSVIFTDGKFAVSGGGKMNLSGSGTSADINVSGGGHVTLDQFKLQKVSATLSGASEARVNSQNITQANLSGASHLYYVDSPTLGKIQTSGGAAISQE